MRSSLLATIVLLVAVGQVAAEEPLIRLNPGGGGAKAFKDVATIAVVVEPAKAVAGQLVKVKLTVTPNAGNWTYPFNPKEGQFSRNDLMPKAGALIFVGAVTDPTGWEMKPDTSGLKKDQVYKKAVTWELDAVVSPKLKPGKVIAQLEGVRVQVCTNSITSACFDGVGGINLGSAEIEVLEGDPVPVPPKFAEEVKKALEPPATPVGPTKAAKAGGSTKPAIPTQDYKAQLDNLAGKIEPPEASTDKTQTRGDLSGLLLTAAFWGLVSLITPCVFPMIPITVSLFLKQAQQSTPQVVKLSATYCLTIVAVLGLSAFFFLTLFREASVDPWMNILLGIAFIAFAVSLFGVFDMTFRATMIVFVPVVAYAAGWSLIKLAVQKSGANPDSVLPAARIGLTGLTLAAEGLLLFGGGQMNLLGFLDRQRGIGGIVGMMFGAVAFSIVSFTCVAPFLGGFSAYVSSGNYQSWELALAALTFSGAFAFPFFFLALFPRLLKKLPKSGGWLDAVKVVMGFLELAAVLKFFRTAELRLLEKPEYFTYDLVLVGWIAISVVSALYLFNVFRLPHDDDNPRIGVGRLLFALGFLGFGIYLAPALVKSGPENERNRPDGVVYAWVDAFLLPDPSAPWGTDLPASVDRVVKEKREGQTPAKPYVFVDFTGVTCTNCKYNEENVFTRPEVKELLGKYELVQMYTDDVPANVYQVPPDRAFRTAEAGENLRFQKNVFQNEQLPLYVILAPQASGKVKIVAVYLEGKINDPAAFTAFLKQPFAAK